MRVLIISDIHANLTALEAVLDDVGDYEATWCLGDIVGYGPDPNECVTLIRTLPNLTCLLGNHDSAVIGNIDIASFNFDARISVRWTQKAVTDVSLDFLSRLPDKTMVDGQTLAHGSPRHPTWEYLLDASISAENFKFFDTSYCFVGHTHLPSIFILENDKKIPKHIFPEISSTIQLTPRAIINPGSVGQPRDRNPLAAYGVFDTDAHFMEFRRVAYDVESVQARMQAADLPQRHIHRLEIGW